MTPLIEWLLGLEDVRLGSDAPLFLRWSVAAEAWVLLCFALLAVAWITLVYRRERVSLKSRIVLAVVRCGIVALAVAVLCQPSLVLQRNRVEPSYVVVALDTSLSMATHETYRDDDLALSIARGVGLEARHDQSVSPHVHRDADNVTDYSRLELVVAALARDDAAPLRKLLQRNAIQLCTFAGSVETRGYYPDPQTLNALVDSIRTAEADGTSTDLAGAISHIIEKAEGRRLAAIVLASDGQATQPPAKPGLPGSWENALDLARGRQIPIFPLRIGSTDEPYDVEVASVRAQESVFVNDPFAVEAHVLARGLTDSTHLTVRLIDQRSGTIVASQQVVLDPSQLSTTVELRTKPTKPGPARYRVQVPALPAEASDENNALPLDVTVLDTQLRVLYVDGYPRYEYRYLKNALLREETMELSVLLISADEKFVQEGTFPVRRFPQTPEELNRYDVVVFGDVDPQGGWLTVAQMNMLLDFVGHLGGGFGLVAGERAAPHRFMGTPLEKLIPVRIDPSFFDRYPVAPPLVRGVPLVGGELTTGFRPRLTPEGRRSRIFRFAADRDLQRRLFEMLPELHWFARTLGPKPGATVLAEHPTIRSAGSPALGGSGLMPIVVTGRYGAGKLFFQATDDTWRWRRHTGELLHDMYWVQVVRELMRSSRVAYDRRFVIRTDRKVYPYGSSVHTHVDIFDSELLSEQGDVLEMVVSEPSEKVQKSKSPNPDVVTLRRFDFFDAHRLGPESNGFEGTWIPPRPGSYFIEVLGLISRPGEKAPSVPVRVERPNLETRRPEANHEMLERIASATGGQVIELDQLEMALGTIRDRSVRIPDDIIEPLWDSKLVLILFVLMISMEWILRKAFGLL